MRYEAKHSFFKHLANILGNFKNVAKTLSERHQTFMCYQHADPTRYLHIEPVFNKGTIVCINSVFFDMTCIFHARQAGEPSYSTLLKCHERV